MTIKETKKQLRSELMRRESELPKEYIAESNSGIEANLLALPEFENAAKILLFYSIWSEPNTHGMIARSLQLRKTVALPQSPPGGIMTARIISSLDELVPGPYGIPSPTDEMPELAPEELDFIVVPSVAFDREGYRIGHGGGYYDRYLKRTGAFSCGIARERMIIEQVPRDKFDVGVDCLVTESGTYRFK